MSMSLLRTCARRAIPSPNVISVRGAHKKASIQVRLNEYVEGVGVPEDIVAVRPGLMRNFLYPAGKASYVQIHQGPRNRQLEEHEKLAAAHSDETSSAKASRRRAHASQIGSALSNVDTLEFQRAVIPDSTNTFGSVTADDLAGKLKEEFNIVVEKSQIDFKGDRIKSLGEHHVIVAGHPVKIIVHAA